MQLTPEKLRGGGDAESLTCPDALYSLHTDGGSSVYGLQMTEPLSSPVLTKPVERMNWFSQCFARMDDDKRHRLIRNLQVLVSSSYFSGIGGFETILFLLVDGVNRETGLNLDHVPCVSACEMATSRQLVLRELDKACKPE